MFSRAGEPSALGGVQAAVRWAGGRGLRRAVVVAPRAAAGAGVAQGGVRPEPGEERMGGASGRRAGEPAHTLVGFPPFSNSTPTVMRWRYRTERGAEIV